MSAAPRLTVGLPVYNGESFLAESLDALLGQTYSDFELIISDNGSTDATADIGQRYARQDRRVRYIRQRRNVGAAPNHNVVLWQARGELFKWASSDDLYARDLIERCVTALDENPHLLLAHSWTTIIDSAGDVIKAVAYPLASASPRPPERFRSMLFASGGDDIYGVLRTRDLRAIAPLGSHHHADRTLVAELALRGPFYQVPDWLYYRRDHPQQAGRTNLTMRARCANLDPRRASVVRNPEVRLYGEYLWAYIAAIWRARLSRADRLECYRYLGEWARIRIAPGYPRWAGEQPAADVSPELVSVGSVVAGQEGRKS
ncbi:MAG: glycosyltransferase family 2 protein [Streptosporangiaceae bacterium]